MRDLPIFVNTQGELVFVDDLCLSFVAFYAEPMQCRFLCLMYESAVICCWIPSMLNPSLISQIYFIFAFNYNISNCIINNALFGQYQLKSIRMTSIKHQAKIMEANLVHKDQHRFGVDSSKSILLVIFGFLASASLSIGEAVNLAVISVELIELDTLGSIGVDKIENSFHFLGCERRI